MPTLSLEYYFLTCDFNFLYGKYYFSYSNNQSKEDNLVDNFKKSLIENKVRKRSHLREKSRYKV